ncbi:MAG: Flagellar biosynthesis protein FliR [Acidimicrobiia bacterium]|nr:Flagellar biosynthesis protein FliR [Acidimicrobiia bacterium]
MQVSIDPTLLAGFLLALVRTSAWIVVTPPFNHPSIPGRVKIIVSAGLAIAVAPRLTFSPAVFELGNFAAAVVYQTFVGLALGFAVYLVFAVMQAAGEIIDFQAGFSAAQLYDPFTQAAATPIGRVYQLLMTAILFAINGHLILVRGFLRSFDAAPIGGIDMNRLGKVLTDDMSRFLMAAVEIAAPLMAALFLTEIVLGLLGRAAPQVNILQVGLVAKIMMVLLLVGVALPMLGPVVADLLDRATRSSIYLGGR